MTELKYQTELVKDAKALSNGYGWKLSNRFLVGIPDLFLADRGMYIILETKEEKWPKTGATIKFGVTSIQETTLRRMANAGLNVAMGLCTRTPAGGHIVFLAKPALSLNVSLEEVISSGYRKENGTWPISDIVKWRV